MIGLVAMAALAFVQGAQDRQVIPPNFLTNPDGSPPHLMLLPRTDPMSPPKVAPLKDAEPGLDLKFPYVVAGFENLDELAQGDHNFHVRLRVFAQDLQTRDGLATQVATMLMRLWRVAFERMAIDHSLSINNGIVDVYLCKGGKAGGEQMFGDDKEGGHEHKVDTIYIYDVGTFTDPVEKAREVAHEYGHAILPAIGGYTKPESWANGYLGEKIFLKWIHDDIVDGRLTPADAMGATADQLAAWIQQNVDPLVTASVAFPQTEAALAKRDAEGMNAYIGLALTIATMYPNRIFARSMKLVGSTEAKDYPSAIRLATLEPDYFSVDIPTRLYRHKLWLPMCDAKIGGGQKTGRTGIWSVVEVADRPLLVKPIRGASGH